MAPTTWPACACSGSNAGPIVLRRGCPWARGTGRAARHRPPSRPPRRRAAAGSCADAPANGRSGNRLPGDAARSASATVQIRLRLPAPGAPLGQVRALGAERRVVAMARIEPGLVGQLGEEALL